VGLAPATGTPHAEGDVDCSGKGMGAAAAAGSQGLH